MLLLAKGKEVNDEDNLMRTKSRECKKMEQEILKINKKVQDLKEKENGCEVIIIYITHFKSTCDFIIHYKFFFYPL